jgi:hypothetical protein
VVEVEAEPGVLGQPCRGRREDLLESLVRDVHPLPRPEVEGLRLAGRHRDTGARERGGEGGAVDPQSA